MIGVAATVSGLRFFALGLAVETGAM